MLLMSFIPTLRGPGSEGREGQQHNYRNNQEDIIRLSKTAKVYSRIGPEEVLERGVMYNSVGAMSVARSRCV